MALMPLISRCWGRLLEIPHRGLPRFSARRKVGDGADGVVILTNPLSKNFAHGIKYEGCPPLLVQDLLANLGIAYSEWSFVDVGCGKGRALMVADGFGFKEVIGVEYSSRLCAEARRLAPRATVLCMDAAEYTFPEGKKVLFFYHPFDKTLFQQLFPNVHGETILIYMGPGKDWPGENPRVAVTRRLHNAVVYEGLL